MLLLSAGPSLALHAALSRWGVHVGEALILDPLATVFGADPVAPVITTYGAHESLKDFRLLTFFPWSRPVTPLDPPPLGLRVTPLPGPARRAGPAPTRSACVPRRSIAASWRRRTRRVLTP